MTFMLAIRDKKSLDMVGDDVSSPTIVTAALAISISNVPAFDFVFSPASAIARWGHFVSDISVWSKYK